MTASRIGLMGFGRIGRNVFRLLHDRDDLDIVAVADIADPEALTYLLKYDSIYGRFPTKVEFSNGGLQYGTKEVAFTDAKTPADTNWGDLGVDIVLDEPVPDQGLSPRPSRQRGREGGAHLEPGDTR